MMFRWIASLTTRFAPWVVGFWFALLLAVLAFTPPLQNVVTNNQTKFLGDNYESVQYVARYSQAFPNSTAAGFGSIVLTNDKGLTDADRAYVASLERWLDDKAASGTMPITNVWSVISKPQLASFLNSADGTTTMISFSFTKSFENPAAVQAAKDIRAQFNANNSGIPADLSAHLTGDNPIWIDYNQASTDSINKSTLITLILVVSILLIIYRSPVSPLIPLATIGFSFLIARGIVAWLAQNFGLSVSSFTDIFMLVIMFGAGTDYCLFLISRFKEELQKYDLSHSGDPEPAHNIMVSGAAKRDATRNSLIRVGAAVSSSAATVIIGMAGMGFAEFGIFNTAGPAVAIGVTIALLAGLTLTPSLTYLLGRFAFWPVKLKAGSFKPSRMWATVANLVVARPLLTALLVLAALTPLAVNSFFGHRSFDTLNDLPADSDSHKGFEVMLARYSPGELLPTQVLVQAPGSVWDDATLKKLDDYTAAIAKLGGVQTVRSATRPLGQAIPYALYKTDSDVGKQIKQGMAYYISPDGRSARVDVIMASEPFSAAARDVIPRLRDLSHQTWGQAVAVGGSTAINYDIEQLTQADTIRVGAIVLVGIFIVLLLLLRNLLTPIYLLATILLSYGATLGLTVFIFQQLPGKDGLVWSVSFFQFISLVALGMDYNILLISRVKEETATHGVREGVRRAVASTGGIITSCGIIMAGTFASLMFSSLGINVQLGFAISFGVLLDTFVIRAALVPAIAVLLGEAAQTRPWLAWLAGVRQGQVVAPAPALVASNGHSDILPATAPLEDEEREAVGSKS
jgi:putative drug exporter of the RND superfamily